MVPRARGKVWAGGVLVSGPWREPCPSPVGLSADTCEGRIHVNRGPGDLERFQITAPESPHLWVTTTSSILLRGR